MWNAALHHKQCATTRLCSMPAATLVSLVCCPYYVGMLQSPLKDCNFCCYCHSMLDCSAWHITADMPPILWAEDTMRVSSAVPVLWHIAHMLRTAQQPRAACQQLLSPPCSVIVPVTVPLPREGCCTRHGPAAVAGIRSSLLITKSTWLGSAANDCAFCCRYC
jgi:hypothetical protein